MKVDFSKMTKTGQQKNDRDRLLKKATRVNEHIKDPSYLPMKSVVASKEVRGKDGYVPRVRATNEATPPADDLWDRPVYRTGDGDTPLVIRPGGLDYKKWPSKGI